MPAGTQACKALVLCRDEKSLCQALERTEQYMHVEWLDQDDPDPVGSFFIGYWVNYLLVRQRR